MPTGKCYHAMTRLACCLKTVDEIINEAVATPIELFGGWPLPRQTTFHAFPMYWIGGRCALLCHNIVQKIHPEVIETMPDEYWTYLRNNLISELAITHATEKSR